MFDWNSADSSVAQEVTPVPSYVGHPPIFLVLLHRMTWCAHSRLQKLTTRAIGAISREFLCYWRLGRIPIKHRPTSKSRLIFDSVYCLGLCKPKRPRSSWRTNLHISSTYVECLLRLLVKRGLSTTFKIEVILPSDCFHIEDCKRKAGVPFVIVKAFRKTGCEVCSTSDLLR